MKIDPGLLREELPVSTFGNKAVTLNSGKGRKIRGQGEPETPKLQHCKEGFEYESAILCI